MNFVLFYMVSYSNLNKFKKLSAIKRRGLILLMFYSLFLFACTKDIGGPGVCFDEEILPIFINNCSVSGCHNSKNKEEGYDFTNYSGIMEGVNPGHPLSSEVYKVIKGNNPSMPMSPFSKLTAQDVNKIKLWITMGAENTSNCKATCDTTNTAYVNRVQGIMNLWCNGCHNSGTKSGGYDLTTYENVKASAVEGKLLGTIRHLPGYRQMPENGGSLSQCDIDAIQKWIDRGMPQY